MAAARKAVVGLKKRTTGIKAYHSCCKSHGCGKPKAPKGTKHLPMKMKISLNELKKLRNVKTGSKFKFRNGCEN